MDTLITKKRRGPKPTGKGTLIGVRLQPDLLGTLDAYIKSERSGASRPEAIRYAIQEFLRGVGSLPPPHRTGEAPKPAKASKATKPEKPAPQLEKPAKSSVSDEEWWAGLSEAERAEILEAEGIRRTPRHAWRNIGRGVQKRLGAARQRIEAART